MGIKINHIPLYPHIPIYPYTPISENTIGTKKNIHY